MCLFFWEYSNDKINQTQGWISAFREWLQLLKWCYAIDEDDDSTYLDGPTE